MHMTVLLVAASWKATTSGKTRGKRRGNDASGRGADDIGKCITLNFKHTILYTVSYVEFSGIQPTAQFIYCDSVSC